MTDISTRIVLNSLFLSVNLVLGQIQVNNYVFCVTFICHEIRLISLVGLWHGTINLKSAHCDKGEGQQHQ